jgi:hypothetical protein
MKWHRYIIKSYLYIFSSFIILSADAQETNSNISGTVLSNKNETLAGAVVTVIHEPTQNKYFCLTRSNGSFHFFNIKPGGPYSIVISCIGYETIKETNLYFNLNSDHLFSPGNSKSFDFILNKKNISLQEIVINSNGGNRNRYGTETIINCSMLQSTPSISGSFQDFLRLVPQAKVTGDGVISLAGQNNRFNAFFIDGANNNDIQGLSVNGTNGGQTGSPPVSIEAIEEIKVLLAPYHVQYGNFTGGSINAITRSGSNDTKASAWYYFRNENLAGRFPFPIEGENSSGVFSRPRLSHFFNQTFGTWISGPLVKNKFFYFALIEKQSEVRPQPFNMSVYKGASSLGQLNALSNFLQNQYRYDPGSFLETKDELNATRLVLKFDWNASVKNKFMLSYRYNSAVRSTPRISGSATSILFENNGFILPATTHSASFEWKRFFKKGINNRLLLAFTHQFDDRRWKGQPFPSVSIFDGIGSIVFGSESNTGLYNFQGTDISLFNVFKFIVNKHVVAIGCDINYTSINNSSIPSYFGSYQFRNLNDFLNGAPPIRLQRSFALGDDLGSKFKTLRSSFFINDEIRLGTRLKLNMGVRLDANAIPSKPEEDKFFNDSAIKIISKYYDLSGATSGKTMKTHRVFSPRIGIDYKLRNDINLRGGAGIFSGHIVNVWTFNVFNTGIGSMDINPQQYGLNFIADPYKQPDPQSLNIDVSDLKGNLHIVARNFKYPIVFRTSVAAEKTIMNNWTFTVEGIFTKNIHEAIFRNVNILPPIRRSAPPDSRNVYSLNSAPDKIPLRSNGVNPYSQVFLMTNNQGKKGSSYSLSFIMGKQGSSFSFNSSYTYGKSKLLFEITGPQTPIASQWRNVETINGRNFVSLSISDNDLQHRITAMISKKIIYTKKKAATTITLFYNGQSGSPYSYVYNGSMINDGGNRETFDLIYIPTVSDLSSMNFAPIGNNSQVVYSAEQQKQLLNSFIEADKYLRKHRGQFAERNGARLPFTHIIDLRLQQDFKIKVNKKNINLSVTYDVMNFTNMLNKNWGRIYFLTNDQYLLIRFAGYANSTTLTPQYQFIPFTGKPYSLQTSTAPGNSARWLSQLGVKINF